MREWTGDGPRVAVVGTGLIGGSVLLRLHAVGVAVTAWDPDPKTRRQGRDRGLDFRDGLAEAVADRDLVFLCAPLAVLPESLATVADAVGGHCVLTDVGSTKAAVAAAARAHGLGHRFVPGHPMAGAERAGLTGASPELFTGTAWALSPSVENLDVFRRLTALLIDVFAVRVVPIAAETHDAVVALASHVPHLLAGSLAGAVADSPVRAAVLGLAAGSFEDGTRVAATPPTRTVDMLLSNREQVLSQLAVVTDFLAELAAALTSADADRLVGHYRRAQAARMALTGPAPAGVPYR
jgi:prephenate dehydrogenase